MTKQHTDAAAGCGDHGCLIAKPKGMATNGGRCSCLKGLPRESERVVRRRILWLLRDRRRIREMAEAVLGAWEGDDFDRRVAEGNAVQALREIVELLEEGER